jgi:hypothetical protein
MEITNEQKSELKSLAGQYWYIGVIITLVLMLVIVGMLKVNSDNKAKELEAKLNVQGTIQEIESRLAGLQARELEYIELGKKKDELNATLNALDKKRKELDKIKKAEIMKNVQTMDINMLNREFSALGINGTVSSGE